jgi:AcrR family transcriptional regulator
MTGKAEKLTQLERRTIAERRLMEAGVNMVAERGLDNISMTEIGVAAGYSRGLPAQYFGTLKQFQKALVHFIALEYRSYALERSKNPGFKSLVDLIRKGCDPAQNDTLLLSILYIVMSDTARDPVFEVDLKGLRNATLDLIELHIRAGIRKKEIRKTADPKRLALIILVSVRGLIDEWLGDRTVELKAAGAEFVNVLSRALDAAPNSGKAGG